MCGIAGFVGRGDAADLAAMTRALAHRGPDGEGLHADAEARVFLGHRRLAIVDLSGGAQPMWNETGDVAVTFNGEIYNHAELRRELAARGHRFRTDHSDTEVLVHGYEEWGEELPGRLDGMFAFAVWDRQRRRLFLARDRFGEKPLYWATQGGLFLFASELHALARHRLFRAGIDRRAAMKYFAHGFIPAPNAFWRDCAKLPAGHWLALDTASGARRTGCYWRFQIEPVEPAAGEAALAEELRALIAAAVERRFMSDVPLGIFLSGGVDSGTAAATAARLRPAAGLDTFTIGFREKSYDESAHARALAGRLGTRHHEEVLSLDGAMALIPEVLGRLDEPMADPSLLPTWLLSRFARRQVTVALSGDGGDELFAGYDPFAALGLARVVDSLLPRGARRGLRRLAELLPRSEANMSLDFRLRRALGGLAHGPELWNPVWLAPLEPGDVAELFQEKVEAEELYSEVLAAWRGATAPGLVDRTLEFYTRFYLQDQILAKVDRASMMHGLEVRAIFLDPALADFARRLPARFKYRRGARKWLLKRALAGLLPEEVLARPKKGFGIPLAGWLRRLPGLEADRIGLGADPGFVAGRAAAHRSGRADHRLFLWAWLALQHHAGLAAAPSARPLPSAAAAPTVRG
jgi:asparagine synthase (glutamine-hydrolysing)